VDSRAGCEPCKQRITYPNVVILVREPFHSLISALMVVFRVVFQYVMIFVVLRLEEVVQDLVIAPSMVPHLSPFIVVPPVSPHVDHVVDGTGTSHDLHIVIFGQYLSPVSEFILESI